MALFLAYLLSPYTLHPKGDEPGFRASFVDGCSLRRNKAAQLRVPSPWTPSLNHVGPLGDYEHHLGVSFS